MTRHLAPRIPLGNRPVIPNTHPLLSHRLDAARNGWPQCADREKAGCPGWPGMACDENAILTDKRWRDEYFSGTGIRVEGDLCFWDGDVNIAAIMDEILDDLFELDPDAYEGAIRRNSGGVTLGLVWRCRVPFGGTLRTRKYTAHPELLGELVKARLLPETTPEEDAAKQALIRDLIKQLDPQKVEFYGPLSKGRQLQYEGKHSEGRDYQCEGGRWPWNTRREDVALMPAQFDAAQKHGQLIDRAEAILAKHLTLIPEPEPQHGDRAYDLTLETLFYPKDGERDTIGNLVIGMEHGAEGHGIRGCLPWTRESQSRANCKLFVTSGGRVAVKDWSNDGLTHYLEADRPAEHADVNEALAEALRSLSEPEPEPEPMRPVKPPPPPEGSFKDAVDWMVTTFCHCKGDLVMPIHAVNPTAGVPVTEFNHRYQKYSQQKAGSKPGVLSYASKVWLGHKDMIDVDGFDMRPDKEFPLFWEDGERFKNIYQPPRHSGSGEVETFIAFMQHLVPDAVERERYLDAVAHGWVRPDIPGPATIMVAEGDEGGEQSGTGRGTLFKILEKLHGWRYAKRIDWEIVTGTSPQATYTDWQADCVLVFVEESKDQGNSRFSERRGVYEHLKSVIDTAPRRANVRGKYGRNRDATLNATFLFATNHADALQIPDSDRRFLIISNGAPLPAQLAERVYAWMDAPGNIAALSRWLAARDLAAYDPFAAPLRTEARERMVEMAVSEMDGLVQEALNAMQGVAFVKSQVLTAARNLGGDHLLHNGGLQQFMMAFKRSTIGLSMPGVQPKAQRRLRPRKTASPERVFVRNKANRKMCDEMDADQLAAEVGKSELKPAETTREQLGKLLPKT